MDAPARKEPPRGRMRPRDAATLIIVDEAGGVPRVLMGKRREDQVFMPGKYVFPGGRVELADRTAVSADDLDAAETAKLLLDMKGNPSPARARALALAAIRETYEEAGIAIGAPPPPGAMLSTDGPWSAFYGLGLVPSLAALSFFARAITPPGRPRRYDTRFFFVPAAAIARRLDTGDGELSGLHWLTLEGARDLDLPAITRVVLEDLLDRLKAGLGAARAEVPYYHFKHGSFRRDLLSPAGFAGATGVSKSGYADIERK